MAISIVALDYRSWLKPLMHLLLSLPTLLHSYPIRSGSNNCLALLRPVVIGDFRSPTLIGGYWNDLAIEWMISGNNHVSVNNRRPDGKVGGNQTEFWGAISFPSVSIKERSLLVPLSRWTHASHLAGQIKYLSTAKLVAWFGPGPT
jgi:hypothetical protein